MAMTPTPVTNLVGSTSTAQAGYVGPLNPGTSATAATTVKKKPGPDSNAILAVAIELLAVGTFTLIAGINTDFGKLMVIFMVGLWLIFLIQESSLVAKLEKVITTV